MKKNATKVLRRTRYLLSCLAGRDNFGARRRQPHRFDGPGALRSEGHGRAQLAMAPVTSDGQGNRPRSRP